MAAIMASASEIQEEGITARPYQLELLDAALNEDTIVNLGTGAGKTFIAVMLIKELSYDILRSFDDPGAKRTFFLVTTVPLVKQQAEHIELHSCLSVGQYTGEKGVDGWDNRRWRMELNDHHVLVMTMTIFKNLLTHAIIKLSQVNLLIFDECHHAVKNHDYVQIMRIFHPYIEAGSESVPRRLGLTASLIPSKCKPGDIERKIRELEEILACRSQTAGDLQQVAKYATNPDQEIAFYHLSSWSEEGKLLQDSLQFLQLMKKECETEYYEQVKLYLDDCLHILTNLGVWCAHQFAVEGLKVLQAAIKETGSLFESEWDRALLHMGWTQLRLFTDTCSTIIEKGKGQGTPLTPKVRKLFDQLINSASPKKDLRGIIFVERRTTAAILTKLIRQKSKRGGELNHIRCDYVVGHNEGKRGTHLRREAHMKTSKQSSVLSKFRSGRVNLLVATSVVEEGVDVPKCNSVIRFDFPPNFRSYIQSKGRARARESKYILLLEEGEEGRKRLAELGDYTELEKELQSICQGRSVPGEEDILRRMEELVTPYRPYGPEGPVAMLANSLSLVHRYCQRLPKDKFTILTPVFVTEKRLLSEVLHLRVDKAILEAANEFVFRSCVQLPMNCPLKSSINGLWMPTKRIADKSAALEAIKELHQVGELNEHLLPISKMVDLSDDEGTKQERSRHEGTAKRSNNYPNKTATMLKECLPGNTTNHLYIIMIHEEDKLLQLYQSQSDDPEPSALGILTSKQLPHSLIPEFSLYDGDKTLCVQLEHYHRLVDFADSELLLLKESHEAIFSELLRIRGSWLHADWNHASKNYLIVPVKVLSCIYPMEVYVDMEQAQTLAEMTHGRESERVQWPCPHHIFTNALVETVHNPQQERHLFQVLRVDSTKTPNSAFPDPTVATTYASYYFTRYKFELSECDEQPALVVKRLGTGDSRIRLLVSRFKNHEGEELKKKDHNEEIHLFPELCKVYPVGSALYKLIRCLPSVLWRLECLLLVDSLRCEVTQATHIGSSGQSSLLLTCTNLRGYEDHGYGELKTQHISFSEGEVDVKCLESFGSCLRGPDNALLLQALTPKGAKDSINLERLETLGDSFLKLSTTVYLFCDRPNDHEGKLTCSRAHRVENFNLYLLAKQRGITGLVFSTAFEPRQMWIPPGFIFQEAPTGTENGSGTGDGSRDQLTDRDRHYNYHRVSDKGVADCVESLIGSYLVSGGIEAAIRFLKWMGIKLQCQQSQESSENSAYLAPPTSKRPRVDCSLFLSDSSSVFVSHFGGPQSLPLSHKQELEVNRLLKLCGASLICKQLNWQFVDQKLLLQALTHASYARNRVTDCYQRLEFLGDAVLDYLVTCHIYTTFPRYSPGDISNMRAALVNNVTFAELSVKLCLHQSLLHSSPSLFKQIQDYIHNVGCDDENGDDADDSDLEDSSEIFHSALDTKSTLEHYIEEKESPGRGDGGGCNGEGGEARQERDIDELDPPKVLGDLLESIAGAIFVDSKLSLSAVWRVFQPLFQEKIASFNGIPPEPPLQQLLHREPSAEVKTDSERNRSGRYRCTVTIANKGIETTAEASTSKTAKAAAARAALRKLNNQQC